MSICGGVAVLPFFVIDHDVPGVVVLLSHLFVKLIVSGMCGAFSFCRLDPNNRRNRFRCTRSYARGIDHSNTSIYVVRLNTWRIFKAISPLLDREAPGLVHLLLSRSLGHTALAALSRPVAGTIGNTLVVTLPGSSKAVSLTSDTAG